ncbi:Na/Pi symporter [Caldibacillus lycopersici]|uniref:Na/Pi symporter n=1 Tax=Perspicuibacillus lycopersici TaxID=1325689 RepID=A0AAE3IV41_9BACI|nr:Na/Pi symporter [Perspicuibacillus lycopersici]MCU9613926.1 Na/Pi symporter [Perspicuibacillus lycopersici]
MLSFFLFIIYIVLFIAGMTVMRTGLVNVAGEKMKDWLLKFTSTPLKGMLFGIFITMILQSSSAVMIITIGLIAARLLTFSQSIGIILGTNIGTTATIEFLAYGPDQFILPLIIIGSVFIVFPYKKIRSTGLFFYGLGAIFLAMLGFEKLAQPLSDNPYLGPIFLQMNESMSIAVLFGCILTAIIQSSTAMTGITMGFMEGHILTLPAAIAIMLGANIGTCVDTYVASIGGGKEAKLSAYAHIWLNIIGVVLFLPFIQPFAHLIQQLASLPDQQIAHASVLFNVVVSLLILPFAKQFARFIEKIHGGS